jgi:predicted dehydrogenase
MADAKKVRVAFVGVGNMGQCAHLRNYAALPECEVVAIAELREDLGAKVAARYGVPRVYRTHEELFAREQFDAVVASQPFTHHGTLLPELLKAGKPVFIEKPVAGSVAMGERVLDAERRSGTFIMVGYHKRSDAATARAKAEIDALRASGEIGKMRYVRIAMPPGDWIAGGFNEMLASALPRNSKPADPPPPDMDEDLYKKYLAFVNYYIHQVNLMRHLLGESYVVRHADPAGILLVGESAAGLTCVIEMATHQTTLDWQESAFVSFERGWLRLDLPAPLALNRPGALTIFKDPGKGATPQTTVPQFPWEHAMRRQAVNFLRAVRGEAPPLTTAAEALEDLKVAREYVRLRWGK